MTADSRRAPWAFPVVFLVAFLFAAIVLVTPEESTDAVMLEVSSPPHQSHQDGAAAATKAPGSEPHAGSPKGAACAPSGSCQEGCYFNGKCFDVKNYPKANSKACLAKGGSWCKHPAAVSSSPAKKAPSPKKKKHVAPKPKKKAVKKKDDSTSKKKKEKKAGVKKKKKKQQKKKQQKKKKKKKANAADSKVKVPQKPSSSKQAASAARVPPPKLLKCDGHRPIRGSRFWYSCGHPGVLSCSKAGVGYCCCKPSLQYDYVKQKCLPATRACSIDGTPGKMAHPIKTSHHHSMICDGHQRIQGSSGWLTCSSKRHSHSCAKQKGCCCDKSYVFDHMTRRCVLGLKFLGEECKQDSASLKEKLKGLDKKVISSHVDGKKKKKKAGVKKKQQQKKKKKRKEKKKAAAKTTKHVPATNATSAALTKAPTRTHPSPSATYTSSGGARVDRVHGSKKHLDPASKDIKEIKGALSYASAVIGINDLDRRGPPSFKPRHQDKHFQAPPSPQVTAAAAAAAAARSRARVEALHEKEARNELQAAEDKKQAAKKAKMLVAEVAAKSMVRRVKKRKVRKEHKVKHHVKELMAKKEGKVKSAELEHKKLELKAKKARHRKRSEARKEKAEWEAKVNKAKEEGATQMEAKVNKAKEEAAAQMKAKVNKAKEEAATRVRQSAIDEHVSQVIKDTMLHPKKPMNFGAAIANAVSDADQKVISLRDSDKAERKDHSQASYSSGGYAIPYHSSAATPESAGTSRHEA